ncbi:hypothetical protein ACVW00_002126 [Marmoricola sp. URHA0025 HA25]
MTPPRISLLRRRAPRFPPLVAPPPVADLPTAKLQAAARYLGTVDESGETVIGQSLSARSAARLSLSTEALDVIRIAGSFRIPVGALRGAAGGERFKGKVVPDLLLVRWAHGGHRWETGFRMEPSKTVKDGTRAPDVGAWVRTISKMARGNDD